MTACAVRPHTERPVAAALKVLLVNPFGELGGAELYLLRLLDSTERLAVEAVLLRDGPLRGELERRGIPVRIVPVGRTPRAIAAGVLRLRRVVAASGADVALANGIKAQAALGPAARLAGLPVVWIKHDHSYDRHLTPLLARLAASVVATAQDVADASGRDDVVLIPPSPAAAPLPRDEARALLAGHGVRWRDGARYLAMTTRLTPYKGVDVAVAAVARTPGWHLVVMGGDDPGEPGERERLLALADELGAADRVDLLDHVDGAARLLTAVDALAVLTRNEGPGTPGREGFGMAAMEAMIAGLPVLAPDDGGAVALRTAVGAGLLVRAENVDEVAAALATISDDGVRCAMSRVAASRAGQFRPAGTAADRLASVLCDAAHRPGAGTVGTRPVSVVMPVLDEAAVLGGLLPQVVAQLRPDDELIVVDSGSRDGTRELLLAHARVEPRLSVVQVDRCSIGASRNHGVRAARHELVVCTDAGCRPDVDWLERMRAALDASDAPELVIGTYRAGVRPTRLFEVALAAVAWPDPAELRRAPLAVSLWVSTFGPRFSASRVDGRSLGFRREACLRAGGFPEHLATAEDEAFGRAMLATGSRSALLADATVTWAQRETVGDAFRQFRGYGRGEGASRSPQLLANELLRAAAYLLVAGGLATGRRWPAAGAAAVVLGFPAHRVVRRAQPLRALWLLPAAQLLKDVGKLTGVIEATALGRRGPVPRPRARFR